MRDLGVELATWHYRWTFRGRMGIVEDIGLSAGVKAKVSMFGKRYTCRAQFSIGKT